MSFSSEVKEELSGQYNTARHCQLAELAAILCFQSEIRANGDGSRKLVLTTENSTVIRKCFTLLKKTFNIETDVNPEYPEEFERQQSVLIREEEVLEKILQAVRMGTEEAFGEIQSKGAHPLMIKSSCCKRAFLRGAFLCIGSMSDPEKSYHLEFVCNETGQAEQIQNLLQSFEIEAKIVIRKKYHVVYLKEGSGISLLLNIIEAHRSLMSFENHRIVKEMRNSINRKVNCETANITKTVNASSKQIEDILHIRDYYGFHRLQDNLREAAEVRLEYPDATLKELGQMFDPPVGKSGVNHRLRKLSELADRIRI